jgi:methionyl aminopeptidase
MINMGTPGVYTKKDGWTVCTKDGMPSAHFEHTITITEDGAKILTI